MVHTVHIRYTAKYSVSLSGLADPVLTAAGRAPRRTRPLSRTGAPAAAVAAAAAVVVLVVVVVTGHSLYGADGGPSRSPSVVCTITMYRRDRCDSPEAGAWPRRGLKEAHESAATATAAAVTTYCCCWCRSNCFCYHHHHHQDYYYLLPPPPVFPAPRAAAAGLGSGNVRRLHTGKYQSTQPAPTCLGGRPMPSHAALTETTRPDLVRLPRDGHESRVCARAGSACAAARC